MRCAACGYEKRVHSEVVNEAILYRSGKKKGQVKEVQQRRISLGEEDPDFRHIRIQNTEGDLDRIEAENPDSVWGRWEPVDIYACPRCGTLKIPEYY